MKALIFAAGLGTRLKPLTDNLPKALVPIAGKPLLEHVILKLKAAGFTEIIVNVHHFPDLIIDFLKQKNNFGIRIEVSDERDLLLDTGGGIRKAAWFFDDGEPFLQAEEDARRRAGDAGGIHRFRHKTNRARGVGPRIVGKKHRRARLLHRHIPAEERRVRCADRPENNRCDAVGGRVVHHGDEDLHGLAARQPDAGARGARAT